MRTISNQSLPDDDSPEEETEDPPYELPEEQSDGSVERENLPHGRVSVLISA